MSQRIKRHGPYSILPGDIVRKRSAAPPGAEGGGSGTELEPFTSTRPVIVSAADIQAGLYTPHDVVLPIPGIGIQLPENDTRGIYEAVLGAFGVHCHPETGRFEIFSESTGDSVDFDPRMQPDTSKPVYGRGAQKQIMGNALGCRFIGGYRHILAKPYNYHAALQVDNEANEILHMKHLRKKNVSWAKADRFKLLAKFSLPASVYPGMLLRELTKYDVNSPLHEDNESSLRSDVSEKKLEVHWEHLSPHDRSLYLRYLSRSSNKRFTPGRTLFLAKIQNNVLHSGPEHERLMFRKYVPRGPLG